MITAAKTALRRRLPQLYDAARFLRLKSEKAFHRDYTVSHKYGGHELSVKISDRVAREWYDQDVERPSSFDLFSSNGLLTGAKVFVLGAHQAVVSLMLAQELGPNGSIVAVEGNRTNYLTGLCNLRLNSADNITLVHAVVSDTNGSIPFSQAYNGMVAIGDQKLSALRTTSVSIDALAAKHGVPDIVMLDIEGYEFNALQGATDVLASKCAWYVEVHGDIQLGRYGKSNADVVRVFDRGYHLFFSPDDLAPFVPASVFGRPPEDRFFLIALPSS